MRDNLSKCNKVWAAFASFIHSQVIERGRTVDTIIVGYFYPTFMMSSVSFMPSPDFMVAGKFKLQRGISKPLAGSEHVHDQQMMLSAF